MATFTVLYLLVLFLLVLNFLLAIIVEVRDPVLRISYDVCLYTLYVNTSVFLIFVYRHLVASRCMLTLFR
jgi:hypothetical protein